MAAQEVWDLNGRGVVNREQGASVGTTLENDARLMDRICARDFQAFEALYRNYRPRLTRFLINLIHRPHLVEEVYNDTMLAVWTRPGSYRGEARLSTWIFAIAYRKAMKSLRRIDEPVPDDRLETRAAAEADPDLPLLHGQLQAVLFQAISELSPSHRAVVDLVYAHEMGYREIAEILGCPISTVKTRMFHARRHLKRRLDGELTDWL